MHSYKLSYISGTYFVIGSMVACIVLQVYFLNLGLARFESLHNVPVFTSTWIVGTVIGGGVFYGEFSSFTPMQTIIFPVGVSLCIGGVVFLAQVSRDDVGVPEVMGAIPGNRNSFDDVSNTALDVEDNERDNSGGIR